MQAPSSSGGLWFRRPHTDFPVWRDSIYVEDASGNLVQKEFAGTESKSETEKLLRQAMEDYENKKFIAKADNITLGELLDIWAEEELKSEH